MKKLWTLFVLVVGFISVANANIASDAYHSAKDGAKKVYHKGKKAGKHFIDAEKRNLKHVVKVGGKVLKTEYDLVSYLATKPLYVVAEYVSYTDRKRPPRRADLVISQMYTDRSGHLIVVIENRGKGYLVMKPNRKKEVGLYFQLNGRDYGGVTQKLYDPRKRLIKPGGRVVYATPIKITKKTKVTAIIDNLNTVRESNERNNQITAVLPSVQKVHMQTKPMADVRPLHHRTRREKKQEIQVAPLRVNKEIHRATLKPDLMIDKIFLNRECKVVVYVKNIGKAPLSDMVWRDRTPESPSVYIYLNGKKWGGATIAGFDKRKRLQPVGGKGIFVSNLKIHGKATITAEVDRTHKIDEMNEKNNIKTKKVECRR